MDITEKQAKQIFEYLTKTKSLNMYNKTVTSCNYKQFINYLIEEAKQYDSLKTFLIKEDLIKSELKDVELNINIV